MTSYSLPSFLLGCGLLVAFLALCAWRGARERSTVASKVVLALLALGALIFHLGVLERDSETGEVYLRPPPMHVRELYHYYVGTKYFEELGYEGLYDATVIADQYDDVRHFQGAAVIRDLRTYEGVGKVDVAQRGPEIQGRFSPERWALFREDIEMFRAAVGHDVWQHQNWLTDHGYNGSPVVTALLGGLANIDPIHSGAFLQKARWFDLALFAVVLAVVFGLHGFRVGGTFAFFWFLNAFNDYNYIGGAYLRYPFAYALALAVACFGRGRGILSGVCLAASTMLRLFPGVFLVGVVLNHLLRPGRMERLRRRGGFYLAFVATCALLVGATWGIRTPDGGAAWVSFARNIRMHAGSYGWNQIGLTVPVYFDAEAPATEEVSDDWLERRAERVEARRTRAWGAIAASLLGIVLAARRLPWRSAMLLGLPLLYVLQPAAHYYFVILGILPLIRAAHPRAPRDRIGEGWAALGALGVLVAFAPGAFDSIEAACNAASLVLGLWLAGTLVIEAMRAGRTPEPEASAEAEREIAGA